MTQQMAPHRPSSHKKIWIWGILICVPLLILTTITSPSLAQTYTYDEVVVEGNVRIDQKSILRFANLPAAGRVTADDLGSAYRRIANTALFETLEIRPKGRRLIIEVVEYPMINEITIEGNKRLKDEQLFPVIESEPRRVYLPSQAEQDAIAIAEQYRQVGRFAADVTPKIIRRSDNRVDLVFEVVESRVIETERISFIGNRAFSATRLRRELASKEAGLLRAFVKSDVYIEERVAADRQQLTEFYNNRGYANFKILSVTAETTPERDAFFIVFTIREGPQYSFGKVTSSSEIDEVNSDEYLQEFRGKSGQIYSPKLVLDGVRRMEFKAKQNSLRFVFVEPVEDINIETREINVNFRIHRGARTFIERIHISGNVTTLDRVIRREFQIAEGDPFNEREIRDSADRIRDLNLFSSVEVNSVPGSSPDQAVVNVEIEEAPTGSLSFGGAWSQDSGITGKFSITERNFLGRGQSLSVGLETGNNATYSIVFVEPRFADRDVALQLSTSLQTTRGSGQLFNTRRWQFSGGLGFPISDETRLNLGAGFSTFRVNNVLSLSHIIRSDLARGPADTIFISYGVNYDSRRTGFNPDIGYVVDFGQKLGRGLKDNSTIITTSGKVGAQTFVLGGSVTLTGEVEGGVVTALNGNTRVRDRFQMHSGLMRGFTTNGIGPRDFRIFGSGDKARKFYLDPLGGNYFTAMRLESRFPIGLPQEIGVNGGIFYDMGSVWGLSETKCANYFPTGNVADNIKDDCVVDDKFNLRSAVGFSLFWDTVFGPLRLNFTKPLQFKPYDNTQTFDLAVASTF